MARTVKKPEERRVEFLLSAQKLFIEHGYYNTSVDDICKEVGVVGNPMVSCLGNADGLQRRLTIGLPITPM